MLSYSWGMTSNKCGCEAQTPSLVPPIEASPLLIYSHFGPPVRWGLETLAERLFKGQSAPQVGDDDLALFDRQRLELAGRLLRIDGPLTLVRIGLEPGRRPGCRDGLVTLSPPGGLPCINGPVTDNPEQPGRRVLQQRALSRQLQKRILNHVF